MFPHQVPLEQLWHNQSFPIFQAAKQQMQVMNENDLIIRTLAHLGIGPASSLVPFDCRMTTLLHTQFPYRWASHIRVVMIVITCAATFPLPIFKSVLTTKTILN